MKLIEIEDVLKYKGKYRHVLFIQTEPRKKGDIRNV